MRVHSYPRIRSRPENHDIRRDEMMTQGKTVVDAALCV